MKKISRSPVISIILIPLFLCSNAFCADAFPHHAGRMSGHHGFHHEPVSSPAVATPFDVSIVQGQGAIRQFGNVTVIRINTPNAILEGNLSTNSNDIVKVYMLSSSDTALLRSNTGFATIADGKYWSNANLFMVNPNGFIFGPAAKIHAANILVSTLNITNDDFLSGCATGQYRFYGQGSYIINQGRMIPKPGGYVCLLSQAIRNEGTIRAQLGTIAIGSGEAITMRTVDLDDRGTIFVAIDKAVENEIFDPDGNKFNNAVENKGTISANSGTVILTAKALNKIFDHAINNSGVIEAKALTTGENGEVKLIADGVVGSSGSLQSSYLLERGAAFSVGGIFSPGYADIKNEDNAITYSSNTNVSGTIQDVANIIIDPNVILSMIADTNFLAGSAFSMDSTSAINGAGYNLSISSGANSTLGNINNVNLFTLSSGSGSNVTLTSSSSSAFQVNTVKTNYHAILSRSKGTGTSTDPVMIYSVSNAPGGLQYVQNNLSGYYKQANNIDASETSSWNSGVGFAPIGNYYTLFTGSFNGNNFAISNLTINTSANGAGLFGETSSTANLSNIHLSNISVSSSGYCAGTLVGYNNGSIANSYSTGSVTENVIYNYVGGLVGLNCGTITNSYSTANVSSNGDYVGGLAGGNEFGSISNSYSTGNVTGNSIYGAGWGYYVGGLVGCNFYSTITNSYSTGNVSGHNDVGGLVGMNNGTISNSYSTGSVNGTSGIGGLVGWNVATITNCGWWTGAAAQAIGTGTGSGSGLTYNETAPTAFRYSSLPIYNTWDISNSSGHNWIMTGYPHLQMEYSTDITNVYQLQMMSLNPSASYILANNIDASETSSWNYNGSMYNGFSPILNFSGVLNGNNYIVSNLYINRPYNGNIGLFATTNIGSSISNVNLTNMSVTGLDWVGSLAGVSYSTIINCFVSGNVTGINSYCGSVGGLIGNNYGPIDNCAAAGTVNDSGYNGQNIFDVGGLIGHNSGSVSNSHATGNVSAEGDTVGGLIGYNETGDITNCYATGEVRGHYAVGGLIGWSDIGSTPHSNTISNCYASGHVIGEYGYYNVGGLVGYNNADIVNCHATGTVDGWSTVGGLVGCNGGDTTEHNPPVGSIVNCYASGNVNGHDSVGGLVGWNDLVSISGCYSNGNVTGTSNRIGGLTGHNSGSVSNSYNTGGVSGPSGNYGSVGGLVGFDDNGTISNCYNTGSISGGNDVGGLVGWGYGGTLSNSYNVGIISSSGNNVGGVAGWISDKTISNCGWWTGAAAQAIGAGAGAVAYNESNKTVFYSPAHGVYNIGGSGQWDMFTPVWNFYADKFPLLAFEGYSAGVLGAGALSAANPATSTINTQLSPLTTSVTSPYNIGYQASTVNSAGGQVYHYQPLTPADIAAFDAMTLGAGDYDFTGGSINLVGHQGLVSMFDAFNRRRHQIL